jgi:hypothetical protein
MPTKNKKMVLSSGRGSRGKVARKTRSISNINQALSKQVDHQKVLGQYPVIKVKDGVAIDLDYTNPQHLKWLED